MLTDIEKLVLLRDSGLLRYVQADELYQLVEIAREVVCPNGEPLFREGELADRFFGIVHGQAELSGPGLATPGARRSRGDFLGHAAALAGEPHPFTATAVDGEVVALGFSSAQLQDLVLRQPAVALYFLREMARHLLPSK